ncbi:MAG: 3-methyl-2-oxobutanoate dehydrogenase subunit VorB [Spiroplasma sp.]|nr:3-methyl-2-oxobutanoate dehydrogenase subunit VorB [Mycoplasmatales bacterium]
MKTLMKGNEFVVRSAITAGCDAFFGYPITPQNEIPELISLLLPQNGGVFVQAESETSAINMVYGAAGAGKRVLTSSSSPGVALKQEGIAYLAGAELPAVIVSVARGGPGLGGIQPSQADYNQATKGGGNGDYKTIVLTPENVQELGDFTQKAFYLADKYRTPVMVLADGVLGQMMEPVEMHENLYPEKFNKSSYAANGKKDHQQNNGIRSLHLAANDLEDHNLRLQKKYQEIEKAEASYDADELGNCEIVIISYGISSRIARQAIERAKEQGLIIGLVSLKTIWPLPEKFIKEIGPNVKHIVALELSLGQMYQDLKTIIPTQYNFVHYGRTGGMIFSSDEVLEFIKGTIKGGE